MNPLPPALRHRIKTVVPSLQGWCSIEKANALAEVVIEAEAKLIVEVGVFGGRSLVPLAMAAALTGGVAYGIDPWRREANLEGVNDPANDAWWASVDIEAIHRAANDAIWSNGLSENCALIRARSETVCGLFQSIDVLHLDGNHSELASCRDVANYLPRLRAGGVLIFDDVNWHTTARAIGLVTAECDTLHDVITHDDKGGVSGHCRVFRKR